MSNKLSKVDDSFSTDFSVLQHALGTKHFLVFKHALGTSRINYIKSSNCKVLHNYNLSVYILYNFEVFTLRKTPEAIKG